MKTILMFAAVLTFGVASAQTDTLSKTQRKTTTVKDNNSTTTRQEVINNRKNPDGTRKTVKTYEGTTKPNTNAVKNNTTGSPDPVRKPTDTAPTPSGTMGPDRTKGGNTAQTPVPNGTAPSPNTGTTTPRR